LVEVKDGVMTILSGTAEDAGAVMDGEVISNTVSPLKRSYRESVSMNPPTRML
jgi:hypothetical protein